MQLRKKGKKFDGGMKCPETRNACGTLPQTFFFNPGNSRKYFIAATDYS